MKAINSYNDLQERKPNCSRLQDFGHLFAAAENDRWCPGGSGSRALTSAGRGCLWGDWMPRRYTASLTTTAAVGCNSNESHIGDECALFITLITVTYPIKSPIMM